MSLIAMAVYSTAENKKDECLRETLQSLKNTVDFTKHRLILSVNASTDETWQILRFYDAIISEIILNDTNIGTAEAINKAWALRQKGENCIKMDDDVVINTSLDWVGIMDAVIEADNRIGQVGLKRKDLIESPEHPDPFYRSVISELETKIGKVKIEACSHIMGTCVMHSSKLLDNIGYLWQPALYGFDDSFMSYRSSLAGFKNVFIPDIDIEHIDDGKTPYQKWKEDHSGGQWAAYHEAVEQFKNGRKDIYYNPFEI
jgi:GT2 family glycosyltransferase